MTKTFLKRQIIFCTLRFFTISISKIIVPNPGFLLYVDIWTRFGDIGEKKGYRARLGAVKTEFDGYEPVKSISFDELINSPENSF